MATGGYDDFLSSLRSYQGNPQCSLLQSLEILQGKWTAKVIFHLLKNKSMRFGDLKKAIPTITNTVLTTTLRALERQEILNREQYNEIPPHVEYSLTEKGNALLPVFYELWHWCKAYPVEDTVSE